VRGHPWRACLDDTDAAAIVRTAGGIILKISHGYQIQEDADPIVQTVDSATDQFSAVTMPGAFLVDVFHARTCYRAPLCSLD
jgi:hypothetical protein